jgi:aryl sulfotransferase
MTTQPMTYPLKTRDIHSNHFDSTVWDDFKFRDDDIVISTYAKSGTTWMQQIVAQLLFNGEEGLPVAEMSPWVDLRVPPKPVKLPMLEGQTHRRFIKTHLPVDALVFSPKAKYIYVARDGRDVAWSLYNHHLKANDGWYDALNNTPGLVGPPMERPQQDNVVDYFRSWLANDGAPFWSMWENIKSWWEVRNLPNVLFINFEDLKKDLPGSIRKIAGFLEVEIDEHNWDKILLHCSFDYMKANSELSAPLGGIFWEGGAKSFINKGTNGRWKDLLTAEDIKNYEQTVAANLPADCAHWLATGDMR